MVIKPVNNIDTLPSVDYIEEEGKQGTGVHARGDCDCCHQHDTELYCSPTPVGSTARRVHHEEWGWLCSICASTHAGNSYWYPEQYQGETTVLKTLSALSHLFLAEIKELKESLEQIKQELKDARHE